MPELLVVVHRSVGLSPLSLPSRLDLPLVVGCESFEMFQLLSCAIIEGFEDIPIPVRLHTIMVSGSGVRCCANTTARGTTFPQQELLSAITLAKADSDAL